MTVLLRAERPLYGRFVSILLASRWERVLSATLLEQYSIRGVAFRNRIAMSPMCMHSGTASGDATDFHVVHYGARALGGAGLVMLETTGGAGERGDRSR